MNALIRVNRLGYLWLV